VNCIGKAAENVALEMGAKMTRDLPHSRPEGALYEIEIPEKKFVRNEKALDEFLSDPQVEGVYESMTPLWFRAVLKLGCIARPMMSAQSSNTGGERIFKLKDLDFINSAAHPYLQPYTAAYRRIFLYCSFDKSRNSGLAVLGLFILDGSTADDYIAVKKGAKNGNVEVNNNHNPYNDEIAVPDTAPTKKPESGRAYVWLVNGNGRGLDAKPPLQRIYRNFQADERGAVKFTTSTSATLADAFRSCGERLTGYMSERRGPTLAVAQGGGLGFEPRQWRKAMPALQDLPLCVMPPNTTDDLFPAVGWQMFIAERMIQRFLIFPSWIDDRLACSRHAHVPLCNLGRDVLTTMIDVSFARALQHNRHLLWSSEGVTPDLGGAEVDQYRYLFLSLFFYVTLFFLSFIIIDFQIMENLFFKYLFVVMPFWLVRF
jgi:DNA polymerase epsilon subunit 1